MNISSDFSGFFHVVLVLLQDYAGDDCFPLGLFEAVAVVFF